MEAEKATYEIARMARLLGVSRSGFYDWQARQAAGPSTRQQRHAALLDMIKRFHVASDEVYGPHGFWPIYVRTGSRSPARRWRS